MTSMNEAQEKIRQKKAEKEADAEGAESMNGENLEMYEDIIADQFAEDNKDKLRFDASAKRWHKYDGARWKPDNTELAFHEARMMTRGLAMTKANRRSTGKYQFANHVERYARTDRRMVVEADHWDRDPFLLGTPEGTVDLRTGELRDADPNDFITKVTAVTPSASADAPQWKNFIHEATGGDDKLASFMQRLTGYAMTGDTSEHLLAFIYGPGGNGKGVFLNTVSRILSDYATEAAMDMFTASKFRGHPTDRAMLRGARLVTSTETTEGREWDETLVKQMTGGDRITARFMRQDNFTFTPQFQLLISGNHQPKLRNVDDAMRRRLVMIPFNNRPPRKDTKLPEKLRAEWPGILRWMIDGCLAWQRDGLDIPDVVKVATSEYFEGEDIFGQWIEEWIMHDPAAVGPKRARLDDLFANWAAYALAAKEQPRETRWFTSEMVKRGFDRKKKSSGVVRFEGIRLRQPSDDQGGLI